MAPNKQRVYQRFDRVEVSFREEGFAGSYFPDWVYAQFPPDRVLVEFTTSVDEKEEIRPLRQLVNINEIRLKPVRLMVPYYSVGDIVDTYDIDGWWVGYVREKVGSFCSVYFGTSSEEKVYSPRCIRIH